jgi:hypothetical protein
MADDNREPAADGTLLSSLEKDLSEVDEELDEIVAEAHAWHLGRGRLSIRASLSQQTLFLLFVGFHLATSLGGVALILWGRGRAADLGIALLVGALFGIGAFMAEVWGRTVDKAAWLDDIGYWEPIRARFRELVKRRQALRERLEALESGSDEQPRLVP